MGKPKEECGIFGIFNNTEASNLTYLGLYGLQHRGQESCGIVASDGKHIRKHVGMGKVVDFFTENLIEKLPGHLAIGHVRYSTTGKSALINAQPLMVGSYKGTFAMAHNGNLTNASQLRDKLEREGSIFQSTNDSEVIMHLIAKSGKTNITESLLDTLDVIDGAYALLFLKKDRLIAVRDPHGIRPLSLGRLGQSYVIASESCAFNVIDAEFIRDINPGEVLIISMDEIRSMYPFEKSKSSKLGHCIFELIYFGHPSSKIFNQSVYNFRLKTGIQLAKEDDVEADVVIPVPDSGRMAAMGYGAEKNIPVGEGLIRSHYIGRTFIEPSQKIRDFGAKIKFAPVKEAISGKRVVVVDDSLVRGTTSRKIISMLRKVGAREVHLRIASPPIRYGCYYGIDFPDRTELAAHDLDVCDVGSNLCVDSLRYISLEGLMGSINNKNNPENFCTACFDCKYPTKVDTNFKKLQMER